VSYLPTGCIQEVLNGCNGADSQSEVLPISINREASSYKAIKGKSARLLKVGRMRLGYLYHPF